MPSYQFAWKHDSGNQSFGFSLRRSLHAGLLLKCQSSHGPQKLWGIQHCHVRRISKRTKWLFLQKFQVFYRSTDTIRKGFHSFIHFQVSNPLGFQWKVPPYSAHRASFPEWIENPTFACDPEIANDVNLEFEAVQSRNRFRLGFLHWIIVSRHHMILILLLDPTEI